MKPAYLSFAALLLAGCNRIQKNVEFIGTAPTIQNGIIIIKDPQGKEAFGDAIKAGKFYINKQRLMQLGYYNLEITDYSEPKNNGPRTYEVYLEPGKYTIQINPHKYPAITSESSRQTDLSAYAAISDSVDYLNRNVNHEADSLQALLNGPMGAKMTPTAYMALVAKLKAAQSKKTKGITAANRLAIFVKKYPQNQIAAHLISEQDYRADAVSFYNIYQQLSPEEKNSDDGKEVGTVLGHLMNLIPGAIAPPIAGSLPDGKPFDIKSMHKKVIIIDFWRSGDQIGRQNRANFSSVLFQVDHKEDVGMVSFSFDTNRDHWIAALSQDKPTWPQLSDLKGDDSPNATNWAIRNMPTYYVITGDGKIIEGDVTFSRLAFVINDYLQKHR